MLKRHLTQFVSLILLHSSWGPQAKWFCNPVLSCHSCWLSWFACPIGVFVHYSGYHLFPLLALGTVLLIGVIAGRLFCGWICPFGFIQDMLHKIKTPEITPPKWMFSIKYFILVITVFLIPWFLGEETLYTFCRICPSSALQVTVPNLFIAGFGTISTTNMVKLLFLVFILAAVVFSSRFFCKVFCPIGALMAPLNHFSFWKVGPPKKNCVSCGKCDKGCPADVHPSERFAEGEPANRALDCIVCHDCKTLCPRK